MKIISLTIAAIFAAASFTAAAAQHTITGGYANTNVKTLDTDLKGVNVKYNYTFDNSPFGLIASVTATEHEETINGYIPVKVKGEYFSAALGASYAVTDWAKPYVMIGSGKGTIKAATYYGDAEENENGFVYGAGIQFTPFAGFTIDTSYEHTKVFESDINTFVLGAGWRF
ncbi:MULTISPECIES: Ail/Lom family outer membrane beta-barrel protein [unclassified Leclercia]|uniref:Outer membrane beta-barrel protein n=1 Tax=Leclercia barmai TaxID=2785629 RepID=A0ABS7RZ47_9ENTR|nr:MULTISPECIES: Ail/Lom family outer membrane beta-barrel protein [unclassified Leclercia]MBZ0059581.1 outer membrane beta-barrel protein [Leclercia sp. EMC7]MCM5697287.1 outer membrane beta-barrel protein [Leclercia sp. LTM01]MCM5702118.1 outer membrane beta-barrel protein [Leclercia sp. LTM14]